MTTKVKPKKAVDLRRVKKHKLYPILNEYIKEIFAADKKMEDFIIESASELQDDLFARYGEKYKLDDVLMVLSAYGEWLPLGGYYLKRNDFYIPVTEGETKS
jgi:hypothetical protein